MRGVVANGPSESEQVIETMGFGMKLPVEITQYTQLSRDLPDACQ